MSLQQSIPQQCQVRRPKAWSQGCAASSRIFFPSETIKTIASASGAFKRQRKLEPITFVTSLAFWKGDTIAYQDLAAEIFARTGESISAQAIGDKVKKAEPLFQDLTRVAIARSELLPKAPAIELAGVQDILIADASTVTLRKSLAPLLPGTTGAAVKIHATFNLSTQRLAHLALSAGTGSDHVTADSHFEISKAGDLIIRDLGYFDITDLNRLNDGHRFFISRIPLSIARFKQPGNMDIDPWQWLAKSRLKVVDQTLTIGGTKTIKARVIAIRLPREKWRKRHAEMQREKGRELTPREQTQAKWNLIITNLTEEQASANTVANLYAMRWQIELLFKALKSGLGIDKIRAASCAAVVKAFIWARLLSAALLLTARDMIARDAPREIGIIKWCRRAAAQLGRIRELIHTQRWLALAKFLAKLGVRYCLRDKHSMPSTREKVSKSSALDRERKVHF